MKNAIHIGDVVEDAKGNRFTVVGSGRLSAALASTLKVVKPNPHPLTIIWGGSEAKAADGDSIIWGS